MLIGDGYITCLVYLNDALDPSNHLVGRRIGRLVQVDHSVAFVLKHGSASGRPTARQRCKVIGLYIQLIVVLTGRLNKLSGFTFKSKGQFDVSMEGPSEEGLI